MTSAAKRLHRDDWLTAGLTALRAQGPEALKAEPLARSMGTTKGSFYWHFEDVPHFHRALLARWEETAQTALSKAQAGSGTATTRLRHAAQSLADQAGADAAIRAWARGHAGAAETLARVDAARLDCLHALLSEVGISNPEMARIILASGVGMAQLDEGQEARNTQSMGSLVDLVLALR
ncbi:TetR/AcrR family transcriptional regulator [Roseovarius sp. A21]|uniref:TetR/AcrR family transcriptional regulator n=1 Tax=Roseovarius bejariae TaxID=2576383 RepID=A0A844CH49_9RHOB|nr:TetR/AcrR family transcriptional regulator [Roseovarius bejariae]MRU14631.1 TetR/AcrR family transcriptional regulator [Roseovarius bejariae]